MKNICKRLGSFLLCLAMVLSLLPTYAAAADMVYLIEDEEDFYAIMDDPYASYRLEADLNLGELAAPIGGDPANHTGYWFNGSLDGNGYSIRYSIRDIEGWNEYGLFFGLNEAEITNLTLYPDIRLDMPDGHQYYAVSPLCVYGYDATVTNVTVDGSITVTGGSANAEVDLYSLAATSIAANCRADVDIDVRMTPDTRIEYWGLNGHEAYFCELYGDVRLEGRISQMYQLYKAQDCVASQYLELYPSYIDFKPDHQGSFNYLENTLTVQPYPGKTEVDGWMPLLNETTGSYYTGSVDIIDCAPQFSGAYKCEGVELDCDITATNSTSYMNGLSYTTDSVFRGDVSRFGGEASYDGLNNCQRCLYWGDITQEAATGGYTCAAIHSSDCVVEGNIYTHSGSGYSGSSAYGLNSCQSSSFTGDIHVVSDTSYATVLGAAGSSDCIVLGDLTAEGASGSNAQLIGDGSYYEGTVRAATVRGIGSNSSANANIYAEEEVSLINGSNSYFSGNVSMDCDYTRLYAFRGNNNVANVNVNMNARGKWNTDSWSGLGFTAIFETSEGGSNNSFSGSATVRASGGVTIRGDFPITVQHTKIGTWHTGNIQGVWRHIEESCAEECPALYVTSLEDLKYEQRNHYIHVIDIFSSTPNVSAGDASAGWDGSIDIEGRYEPEREPADYTLLLTDMMDIPIPGARLILGGASYITDDGGYVDIKSGPGVISPLEVQLLNDDGEYETVLTRQACYPIPNRVNVIRLEPVVDMDVTFLASEDATEGGGTASGGNIDIAGQKAPGIQFPLNVDVNGTLGKQLSFAYKWNPKDQKMSVTISTSTKGGAKNTKFDQKTFKKLVEDLKSDDYDTWSNANQKLQRAESIGAAMGFGSWKCKAMGFVEMRYTEAQTWEISDSGFGVGASGELRGVTPIGPPGVYLTSAVSGSIDAKGHYVALMDGLLNGVEYQATAELGLKGRVESALGAGLRSARLYAELGIGAELTGKLSYPWESTEKSLKLDAAMDVFGEVNCMIFSHRITIIKLPVHLWPQQTAASALSRAITQNSDFAIAPRNYAQGAVMQTLSTDAPAASYLGLNSENSYPYAEVSLHRLSNGNYLLVYTDDDLSRGAADRSALRACIGREVDGELVWGEAVTIENDGTGDYGFAAAVSGNAAAIVWQDATQTFGSGENIDPADMAAAITLSQTVLDCSGETPVPGEVTAIAETGSMPYFPTVYYDGSTLSAAWVTSSNPDPSVYLENEAETLWLSSASGAAGEAVAVNQAGISGIALLGTNLYWTTGEEGNVTLRMRDSQGSTAELDSGNILSLQSSGENLCYTKDDALFSASISSGLTPVQTDAGEGYKNILRLSSDGKVYAAQPGTEESRIFEVADGKALPIGVYDGYLSSWDVCDGHIVTVVRSGFEETDTAGFGTAAQQQIEDMEVDELVWDNPEAAIGSYVNFTTTVSNDGYNALDSLAVTVTAADGTVLSSNTVTCDIQPGESQEIGFGFTVPEGFTAQDVTVSVGDQSQTLPLGGSNLKAEARWSQGNAGGMTVKVSNTGLGASSGTVTVSDGSRTLYTGEVTVEEGQIQSIWVPFEEPYTETTTLTVTLTEGSGAIHTYDNEDSVTVTPASVKVLRAQELTLNPGESETLQVRALPENAPLPQLSYRSENEAVAAVDANGHVTAAAPGETNILITTAEGVRTTVTVTVLGEGGPTDPTEPDTTDPSEPSASQPTNPSEPDGSQPTIPDNTNPSEPDDPQPTEPEYDNPFVDVPEGQYYYTPVLWAVSKGITNGLSADTFGPDATCTRGQIVTFLWRANGSPEPESSSNPFSDVHGNDYFYKAVLWAVERGITTGTSAATFSPDAPCTRGQVATFLWRSQNQPASGGSNIFTDVARDAYYYDAVLWAVANGITNGMGDGTFAPDSPCTRGQIVTFLHRALA